MNTSELTSLKYSGFFGKRQATRIWEPLTKRETFLNKIYKGDQEQVSEPIMSKPKSKEALLDFQHLEVLLELEKGTINE